jgi:glycosyltransferase involved in cell wall biosynthesis
MLRDPYPPYRADMAVLFGRCLPLRGIQTDLLAAMDPVRPQTPWPAGKSIVRRLPGPRWFAYLCLPLVDLPILAWARQADFVQARDRIRSGLIGLLAARIFAKPFVYWMSFPIAEGHAVRARELRAEDGKLRKVAAHARAWLARSAESWVLRRADHLFVQSDAMRDALALRGLRPEKMTVVPMGIDLDRFRPAPAPLSHPILANRRVVAHLGTIGQSRSTHFLLTLIQALRVEFPEVLLLIVGDGLNEDDRHWIRKELIQLDLGRHIHLTGWISQREALRWVASASIGLSPIPRGALFDVSSPTKVGEYLALGIPCVANDIPDQQWVLEQSQGGFCVPMQIDPFVSAIRTLLLNPEKARRMGADGSRWISEHRSYDRLADQVATTYRRIAIAEPSVISQ